MTSKPTFKAGFGTDAKGASSDGVKRNFVAPTKKQGPTFKGTKNKDTVVDLLGSLNKQPKFTKMVLYSVGCVDKLAVDEVSAEEIINEGGVETFMNILRNNPDNEQVAEAVRYD